MEPMIHVMRGTALALFAVGCASGVRASFRPTDASFTPRPAAKPLVYIRSADVPRGPMRSVGIIEVSVPKGRGIEGAIEAAATKGQEIGCGLLVEHSVFGELEARAFLDHGAAVTLVHGGPPHVQNPSPRSLTKEFDCVVRATPIKRA